MKKVISTDIIPVSVFLEMAQNTRKEIAKQAKAKHAPLIGHESHVANKYDARLIHIETPKVTEKQISVNLAFSQVALAFEDGAPAHTITAKNFPRLVFEGTNAWEGQKIWWKTSVNHPGFKARPYMEAGKKNARQKNLELLSKTAFSNMRLIISRMQRKV